MLDRFGLCEGPGSGPRRGGQRFLNVLANVLNPSDPNEPKEPLYSSLLDQSDQGPPDQDALDFVAQYVTQVQDLVSKLKQAIHDDDVQKVRLVAQTLKGSGTSYGFSTITDRAKEAIRSLDSSGSINEALAELRRLESACTRLNGSPWSSM